MQTLDGIIAQAVKWDIDRIEAEAFCEAESLRLEDLWNRMAVRIAKCFEAGMLSFDEAAAAMNAIWHEMVEDAVRFGDGFEFPEPAFSIYEAFDAGEFDHGDGGDPVEKYTKPRLAEILQPRS